MMQPINGAGLQWTAQVRNAVMIEQDIAKIALLVNTPLSLAALRDVCVEVCSHYPGSAQQTLSRLFCDLSANATTQLAHDFGTMHAERIPR